MIHQHDEFVAANARYRVGRQHRPAQTLRDFHEVLVAHLVTQGVVDDLEIVQVQQQQSPVFFICTAGVQRRLDALAQQVAVGQTGQRVEVGQLVNRLLVGEQPRLHGAQLHQQAADLVVPLHDDGRIELPCGNLAEHRAGLPQGANNGANQHGAQEPEQCHGCQQRTYRPLAHLRVALHARLVGGVGLFELQVNQGLDVRAVALIYLARRVGQAQGFGVVQAAQSGYCGFYGIFPVPGALLRKAFRQQGFLGPLGRSAIRGPQLVDGVHVAFHGLCRSACAFRLQGGACADPGWRGLGQRPLQLQLVGQHQVGNLPQTSHRGHALLVHRAQAFVGRRQPPDAHGRQQGADRCRQHHQDCQARADAEMRKQAVPHALR